MAPHQSKVSHILLAWRESNELLHKYEGTHDETTQCYCISTVVERTPKTRHYSYRKRTCSTSTMYLATFTNNQNSKVRDGREEAEERPLASRRVSYSFCDLVTLLGPFATIIRVVVFFWKPVFH